MADKKAQGFLFKQQAALAAVVDGLEALDALKVEYDALNYGSITSEDLEDSSLEDFDPAVFPDTWNAFAALYADFLIFKTVLYKALP